MLAERRPVPAVLRARARRSARMRGMLITAAIVLVVSNLVDLSAIASVGSACSLVIFLLVGVAAYRLRAEIGARTRDRARGDRRDGDRARLLRRRHAPQRTARRSSRSSRSPASRSSSTWSGSASAAGPRARPRPPPRKRSSVSGTGDPEAAPPPAGARRRSDRYEFLLRFARAGHEAGYPTADLEERVLALAGAVGLEDAQISVTPTVIDVTVGSLRAQRSYTLRVRPSTVDLDASRSSTTSSGTSSTVASASIPRSRRWRPCATSRC